MAFPTVLSSASQQFSTDATSHSVAMPATVNAGDILIVQLTCLANGAQGYVPAVTTPSGWTEFVDTRQSGGWSHNSLFGIIAAGTEGGTNVAFANSNSVPAVAIVTRIQAGTYHSDVIANIMKATGANQSSGEPNPPSLTHGWGAVDVLAGACVGGGDQDTVTGWPSGFTDNQVQANCGGSHPGAGDQSMGASATANLTTATVDPGTFTVGSNEYVTITWAIRGASISTSIKDLIGGGFIPFSR